MTTKSAALVAAIALTATSLACTAYRELHFYTGAERSNDQLGTLEVPESLELLHIDGLEVPRQSTLARSGPRRIYLLPGEHRVVVYYDEIWMQGDDDYETLTSDPVVLDLEFAAGTRIALEIPEATLQQEARAIAARLQVTAVDRGTGARTSSRPAGPAERTPNKLHRYVSTGSPFAEPELTGLETPAVASASSANAVPATESAAPSAHAGAAATPAGEPQEVPLTSIDRLMYWWERATPGEREAFRVWIESH